MVHLTILKDRDEWLENRRSFIGGSEAAAIIGMNPYLSNVDLWEIKTGRREPEDISDKPYVKYGTEAEQYLRELFKLDFPEYEVQYQENNSYTNDKYPWAAASLDGVLIEKSTGRKGILEIKTTNILQSMQREKWDHQIPQNYFAQTLFYLAVTESEFVWLKAQLRSEFDGIPYLQTRHYYFERSEVQDDIDYLMEEGRKFWEYVKTDRRPPLKLPVV